MKIVCIGGGPAGLYCSLLMKKQNPGHQITVIERHRAYDTFGWGVAFSDHTFDHIRELDDASGKAILQALQHWQQVHIEFKGSRISSNGHGFCAIGRKRLLNILQERCEDLGVQLLFEQDVQDDQALAAQYQADLVIAADGMGSAIRSRYAATFVPHIEKRKCRFVWLGTRKRFDGFTFSFEETAHGWFQAHAYHFDDEYSNFIIETAEDVWQKAGLDSMSVVESLDFCEKLFYRQLDGQKLLFNPHLRGSGIWTKFSRIACEQWLHVNQIDGRRVPVVLLGDAAHTTHYSLGVGTKLALEDAIELAHALSRVTPGASECAAAPPPAQVQLDRRQARRELPAAATLEQALANYQQGRMAEVMKMQIAARNSMDWFENVTRYTAMEAPQFAYSLLTRSQRLSHERLRKRDPQYVHDYERWIASHAYQDAGLAVPDITPAPILTPFRLRGVLLQNRMVAMPAAQFAAQDGVAGDFHLVQLGLRALGGAGLVFTDVVGVSPAARITPACAGMYTDAHTQAWQRIADFVHRHSGAKIAIRLGHAGPRGSGCCSVDNERQPLPEGSRHLLAASGGHSGGQFSDGGAQAAQEATPAQMQAILADFVQATIAANQAGFDWLELHCGHGYLLSSFISPLTNRRMDEYGGSLENRCRFPLQVFAAMRAVWPQHKPFSVCISAHDRGNHEWDDGGITPDDAVSIAARFKAAGADMIDCSPDEARHARKTQFGHMFQTPFSDRVRNEADIPAIAVGAIVEPDHANGIIAAGRADLCVLAESTNWFKQERR